MRALGCELVSGDLGDTAAIARRPGGCDGAIHAAACTRSASRVPAPGDVRGERRRHRDRARRRAEAKIPKVVYVSTFGAFGNTHHEVVDESYEHPGKDFTSYYEQTKVEAHRIAKRMIAEGLPCAIVQPGGVYGPDDPSQIGDHLTTSSPGSCHCSRSPTSACAWPTSRTSPTGSCSRWTRASPARPTSSRPDDDHARAIGTVAAVSGRKPPQGVPTGLIKALTPLGPLVGKIMGQPPNLRELISSADGVTFWASTRRRWRSSATPRVAWRRACARRSRRTTAFPSRPQPDGPRGARHRHRAPRAPARDRVLGGRRGAHRPRPRVLAGDAARGARRRAARGRLFHPHPPRPRGRDRRAGAALARDLRSTSTSAAPPT